MVTFSERQELRSASWKKMSTQQLILELIDNQIHQHAEVMDETSWSQDFKNEIMEELETRFNKHGI